MFAMRAFFLLVFALPLFASGVPARGRQAFIDLRCHSCHRVAEDPSMSRPGAVWEGPLLHDLGKETPQAIAQRIVARARTNRAMAQSCAAMTDGQLHDIVAYLRAPR
jgi:mono/diheme cytochrome c family protein